MPLLYIYQEGRNQQMIMHYVPMHTRAILFEKNCRIKSEAFFLLDRFIPKPTTYDVRS